MSIKSSEGRSLSGSALNSHLARKFIWKSVFPCALIAEKHFHIVKEILRNFKPFCVESADFLLFVLSLGALSAGGGVGLVPTLAESESALDMVQEGEGAGGEGMQLIAPRRLHNPCIDSPQRMDLHRELLFNQRIGKNVLNQKSELEKALSKHKDKQIMNQVREHKETPELERAIAERARRLEQAEQTQTEEVEPGTNPTLQEVRARLRHAAPPSPAASAH